MTRLSERDIERLAQAIVDNADLLERLLDAYMARVWSGGAGRWMWNPAAPAARKRGLRACEEVTRPRSVCTTHSCVELCSSRRIRSIHLSR